MSVLKWVLHHYLSNKEKRSKDKQVKMRRENTKYEEVHYTKDSSGDNHLEAIFSLPGEELLKSDANDSDDDADAHSPESDNQDNKCAIPVEPSDDQKGCEGDKGVVDSDDSACHVNDSDCEEEKSCVHFYDDLQHSRRKDDGLPSGCRVEYSKNGQPRGEILLHLWTGL